MVNQRKDSNEKTQSQSLTNSQASGSQYHKVHASHVAGYGDLDPNAEGLTNSTENNLS